MKKFDVNFEKIAEQDLLGKTNHDMGGFGSTGKSFLKNEPLILEEIKKSYIAIENITNIVHWNCCCQIYDGCPTIENFLNCDKRYCCYCQFVDRYNFDLLPKVKRDINLI